LNVTPEPKVLRVALDTPLRRLFDYLPPASAAGPVTPGVRVRVPFGRQRLIGLVMASGTGSEIAPERLKPVLEVLDAEPVLDAAALALLSWAADYYHHPVGEVVAGALPKALRAGAGSAACEERWMLSAEGVAAHARGEPRRAPRQRALLEFLALGGGSPAPVLEERVPHWRAAARALVARGWVMSTAVPLRSGPSSARVRVAGPELSGEQAAAVQAIVAALGGYAAFVLHGITGSGKTEVYLRLIERVLAAQRRVLVLVPEIGLTPQLVGRFRERFDTPMAVLHSALTDHERLLAWRDAFAGHARIVLGTRSAVFTQCRISASSCWTRSTTPPSSSTKARCATRHATWPWCARATRACRSYSARRRRRSRPCTTWRRAATPACGSSAAPRRRSRRG
jgi:primosomal protein N' (replication factor Y)